MHSVRSCVLVEPAEFLTDVSVDGLALAGNAPKIFTKVTRRGLPLVSLIFCALFSCLAYMGISSGSGKVFNWFVNSELNPCLCRRIIKLTNRDHSDLYRRVDDLVR